MCDLELGHWYFFNSSLSVGNMYLGLTTTVFSKRLHQEELYGTEHPTAGLPPSPTPTNHRKVEEQKSVCRSGRPVSPPLASSDTQLPSQAV